MKIVVVTLFPELVRGALEHGVLGRAMSRGLVQIECVDPRQYAADVHKTVDDRPYGGGPGMVGTPAPWAAAIDLASSLVAAGAPRVHLSAQGERFEQAMARDFAALPALVLVASRYEGLDQRVIDARIDREVSLGDYVLSGGEFAALTVIDAVVRLLDGVLNDADSAIQDSFEDGLLDCPHYTRSETLGTVGVPEVLLSGNHALIARWRRKQSLGRTWLKRPDLLDESQLSEADAVLLAEFKAEQTGNSPADGHAP